jgi:hypothetical protein
MATQAAKTTTANKPPTEPKAASSQGFQFPEDLGNYGMLLKFGPYSREVALENKKVDHNLFIYLPVPANLGEVFGVSYSNVSMGLLKPAFGMISGVVTDMKGGTDFRKSVTDRLANGINNMAKDNNYTWALAAAASTIQGLGGDALTTGVNLTTGMIPNPNLAVGFNNVPLRSYTFSWRFAPRSVDESQTVADIIFNLKQRMHPLKDNFALRYPDYCNVELFNGAMKEVLMFKTSVVTDMRVNYAPSGIPSFFAGSQMPTEIDVSLSFNEIEVFTRDDFKRTVVAGAGAGAE